MAKSSVLFTDVANTIDGDASATASQQATALFGYGTDGGAEVIAYNSTTASYNTATYLASGYTPGT